MKFNPKQRIRNISKLSEFFSNVLIQMVDAQKYSYSLQAICAIITARRVMKIDPFWNPKFNLRLLHRNDNKR